MPFARARAAILLLFGIAAIASAGYWIRLGMPVEMASAPTGRISCVSYAPYRKAGESPFTPGYRVTAERIDEDLKALSRRFDCVRTYSVGQGLDQVPAIARRYGMKVLLGAWLGRNAVENAGELEDVIRLANAERDVIRAIVVGNEVLLRGELPQRTIAEHVRTVRAATGLPVTYADVWEFWLKYREVAPAVDFITIHILPYWEDEPIAVEHAVDHVESIYRRMQAAFPGREFLIGETGWPSQGRQRWRAVPSRVNEARFFREFIPFVERSHLPYNVIEAFDQPWKRALEGTVGGYWGLYDDDLRDKFALSGPVVEESRWWLGLACGAGVAAAFALFGLFGRARTAVASIARASFGFVVGATAAAQVRHIVFANRDAFEWALTGTVTALAIVTALVVGERVARWISTVDDAGVHPRAGVGCAPMTEALSWSRGRRADGAAWTNGVLLAFWLVAATIVNLLLVFDSRYRDFPSTLFAPVVVAFAALAITHADRRGGVRQIEERMLVGALIVGAAVIVAMELPINLSADFWGLLCVTLAASTWAIAGSRGSAARDRR